MANPAPTINQINAFNATQGTTIDFNIIGGTELVRSNKIYIYDLSDNSLICTHLYVSTESIHELPANTDGSIVYESGKSSADFVNGAQYYAQIQTFTDIAGTQGGSGLSVSKLFWCLVDPSLTIDTIPSSISTTSYNVSATYDANTSVVSNIIQQYQFNLFSATGSLLQSSGVVVGNGEQQGTSTAYDISYNFSGLSVGSSYYVAVDVTTTQGMSISAQSSTFTVSIDTPTLGEATVVNNACDGYISVTSNLSSEYGGSASGEIATFETDSVNRVTKLEVELDPIQLGEGTPSPSNVRPIVGHSEVEAKIEGKNLLALNRSPSAAQINNLVTVITQTKDVLEFTTRDSGTYANVRLTYTLPVGTYTLSIKATSSDNYVPVVSVYKENGLLANAVSQNTPKSFTLLEETTINIRFFGSESSSAVRTVRFYDVQLEKNSTATDYVPYIDPIEVSQDFNVTLTPTVIDETPYLFKKTGDVRGDRESLELVGGTVNWNQLYSKTNTATDNGVTYTNTNGTIVPSGTSTAESYYALQISGVPSGHKILFTGGDKNASSTDCYSYIVCNGSFYNLTGGVVSLILQTNGGNIAHNIRTISGVNTTALNRKFTPQIIDLTAFFGNSAIADYVYSLEQANAGDGIAWLRKYFPYLFAYNPYNTGTLESVKPTAHVTRGVNQWDEEWEVGSLNGSTGATTGAVTDIRSKNYIPVKPSTAYYIKSVVTNILVCQYDANKNFVGAIIWGDPNKVLTTSATCRYLKLATYGASGNTYNHDICLNLSNADINGKYFPADHHTYPISELELRGMPKLVDGELRFDGDTRKADGSNNVNRKYGIVTYNGTQGDWDVYNNAFYKPLTGYKRGSYGLKNAICDKFENAGQNAGIASLIEAGRGKFAFRADVERIQFYPLDSSITTSAQFNAWLSNNPVTVVYEKATQTTETADPFADPQEVSIYGTEEFVSSNGVPVGNKTTYKTRDIFGGTIDLASGVLTVTNKSIIVDGGTSLWTTPTGDWIGAALYVSDMTTERTYGLPNNMLESESLSAMSRWNVYAVWGNLYMTLRRDVVGTDIDSINAWLANNPLQVVYPLATPLTYQLTPQQIETLIGTNNVWSNAGDVLIEFNIPITNLLVKRQDVDDVSGNWLTLYSQPVEQASDMDFTFIDFLNQYGKTYKYALVPLLTQTQSGVEVEVEGGYTVSDEVQSIFDGVYIGDSTGVQRLKAGVAYNNLNTNQQVGVIPTLGNKYPIIVSNSNIQYDTGSVSGLIVPDDFYSNGNLSRLDMSDKREVINDFLTNKKPKILKDWNGNIWLVVFTDNVDVSFDNNYGMGIATFTSGWTEVGDPTNQEDLQRTGIINVGGD